MLTDHTHAGFRTTQWDLIDRVRRDDQADRQRALDTLVRIYWPPIYSSLRVQGQSRDRAEEITQGFFVEVAIGRVLLEKAERGRGRLRDLMLTALRHYVIDGVRREHARGRGVTVVLGDLDREESLLTEARAASSDEAFDKRWALALAEEALARCEAHWKTKGKARNWEVFFARRIAPLQHGGEAPALSVLAQQHGFASPADAAAAVQTVGQRLEAILCELCAEFEWADGESTSPLNTLAAVLESRRPGSRTRARRHPHAPSRTCDAP